MRRDVKLHRCATVSDFLGPAGAFLEAREAEHNLIFGLCSRLAHNPREFGPVDPYFAYVELGGTVVAAAMRTPPFNLILSEMGDVSAVGPLAVDAMEAFEDLPGVVGPPTAAAAFAGEWERLSGHGASRVFAQRIYRCDRAVAPPGVPGAMRRLEPGDRDLAVRWTDDFMREALPHEVHRDDPQVVVDRRLADPDAGLELWIVEDRPVSLAGYGGSTPNGIRVGPVYTPPELRRRGYATALVASMTTMLLDRGLRHCYLYTDLANPTSNDIYQRIGYRPVTDADQYVFA